MKLTTLSIDAVYGALDGTESKEERRALSVVASVLNDLEYAERQLSQAIESLKTGLEREDPVNVMSRNFGQMGQRVDQYAAKVDEAQKTLRLLVRALNIEVADQEE